MRVGLRRGGHSHVVVVKTPDLSKLMMTRGDRGHGGKVAAAPLRMGSRRFAVKTLVIGIRLAALEKCYENERRTLTSPGAGARIDSTACAAAA
jgi:hypothetical protein